MNPITFQRARQCWYLLTLNPHQSYRELAVKIDVNSTCAVERYVRILKQCGYIETMFDRARSIRVLIPFGQEGRHG